MKYLGVLLIGLFAGCTSLSSVDLKPADAPQTTPPPTATTAGSPQKVKQWFTTDTPETLPQDKLDKMNLGGAGGFSGY
jgi:hypothetical protein